MLEFQHIEEEKNDMSTQFLQIQKNKLLQLQQQYERYVNTLPVVGFNSMKYDLNLIKYYLLPYLIHYRDTQPTINKKNLIILYPLILVMYSFSRFYSLLAEQHH